MAIYKLYYLQEDTVQCDSCFCRRRCSGCHSINIYSELFEHHVRVTMRPGFSCLSLLLASSITVAASTSNGSIVASTFTVPGPFPTSVYSEYYNPPTGTSAQV